jgi:hypothetical protein
MFDGGGIEVAGAGPSVNLATSGDRDIKAQPVRRFQLQFSAPEFLSPAI